MAPVTEHAWRMLLRLEGARLVPASGEHSNITCATDRRSRRRVAGANDSPRRRHRGDAAAASRISNFLDSRAPCKGLPLACCLVLPFRFWTLRPACLRRSKLQEAAYEPRGPKKSWDNTLCAGLKVHGGPSVRSDGMEKAGEFYQPNHFNSYVQGRRGTSSITSLSQPLLRDDVCRRSRPRSVVVVVNIRGLRVQQPAHARRRRRGNPERPKT